MLLVEEDEVAADAVDDFVFVGEEADVRRMVSARTTGRDNGMQKTLTAYILTKFEMTDVTRRPEERSR